MVVSRTDIEAARAAVGRVQLLLDDMDGDPGDSRIGFRNDLRLLVGAARWALVVVVASPEPSCANCGEAGDPGHHWWMDTEYICNPRAGLTEDADPPSGGR